MVVSLNSRLESNEEEEEKMRLLYGSVFRKVDVRLPEKSISHGTRPVHLIITMIK